MKFNLKNIKAMVIAWTEEGSAARKHIMYEIEGLEAELREVPNEREIKLWLANTEDLPLVLRVQTILGLYRKEILGE